MEHSYFENFMEWGMEFTYHEYIFHTTEKESLEFMLVIDFVI